MVKLSLYGPASKQGHYEQLLKEFSWIMENLNKNKQTPEYEKWITKLTNWTNAHPEESKQLLFQVFGSYNLFNAIIQKKTTIDKKVLNTD